MCVCSKNRHNPRVFPLLSALGLKPQTHNPRVLPSLSPGTMPLAHHALGHFGEEEEEEEREYNHRAPCNESIAACCFLPAACCLPLTRW